MCRAGGRHNSGYSPLSPCSLFLSTSLAAATVYTNARFRSPVRITKHVLVPHGEINAELQRVKKMGEGRLRARNSKTPVILAIGG